MKQKAFSIIFKRLSLKQIKTTFLEGEGATLKELRIYKGKLFLHLPQK